jgi:SRSO17 transposase
MMSEIPRKTLPAIAKAVGLDNEQSLHHFLTASPWESRALREKRLQLIANLLGDKPLVLCIDETGDRKKGKTTDYVARQYIGNLGKVDNGIVSVNAYGVVDGITVPLNFRVFKPQKRLQEGDRYQSKPQLAIELIQELHQRGFSVAVVLADSLYGESSEFINGLNNLSLKYVVAIRENHGVLMPAGQRVRYTRWRIFDRVFDNGDSEVRFIREIIFGHRCVPRYYQITTDSQELPPESTWLIMTNLAGNSQQQVGHTYGLRTWIEYGFKQSKNELGWADFRLTDYSAIEKWGEIISSVYLLVSLQTPLFKALAPAPTQLTKPLATPLPSEDQDAFQRHP